jgi:hypothetical protein
MTTMILYLNSGFHLETIMVGELNIVIRIRICVMCFLKKGAFTITIQLGNNQLPKLYEKLSALSPKTN